MTKTSSKYDARLRAVSDALATVEAPGDFLTSGSDTSFPLPGLVVDGVGDVLLPITDAAAKAVISASRLAPFGLGEKTLVDTQVRHTWELSTSQFRLVNAAFNDFVATQIAEPCRGPLGIHESVVFEAKLYKLLLYEPGGKFARHQDSEKENGMFGTLVVVLPGRFEGGELVVHAPSSAAVDGQQTPTTHVFDAAAMDAFAIKYAAFYGDCPHEVKPVTSGYRLCLTYNLVKTANPTADAALPQFGANHKYYAALEEAMKAYFCTERAEKTKRRRTSDDGTSALVGFDVTKIEMYREAKLVYVLTHKYTKANLSFENLKHRDAVVAASLGRFCDSSQGALGLYLCKMEYEWSWSGEESDMYYSDREKDDDEDGEDDEEEEGEESDDISRKLELLPPWVEYMQQREGECDVECEPEAFCKGSLTTDVAPCGVLEQKGLKFDKESSSMYTGNEGASSERWYSSAALVVAPADVAFRWTLEWRKPLVLLRSWLELVESKPLLARTVALKFGEVKLDWSPTSELGLRVIETAAKLGDVDVLSAILSSIDTFEFQPKLGEIVASFEVNSLAKIVKTIVSSVRHRSRRTAKNEVNLVASVLNGATDPAVLTAVLDAVTPVPTVFSTGDLKLSEEETTPEEYARLLAVVIRASEDRMKLLVDSCETTALVLIVAPAIRRVFGYEDTTPRTNAMAVTIANHAIDRLKRLLPSIRTKDYKFEVGCDSSSSRNSSYGVYARYLGSPYSSCAKCKKLREFMASLDETATFKMADFDSHLKPQLESVHASGRFVVQPLANSATPSVVLKNTFESAVYKQAIQEIAALGKLEADSIRKAVVCTA